jgi:uncharacterized membrane protein
MKVNPHKSSTGMDANTLALLSYIAAFIISFIPFLKWVAWAAPLVIFLIEKNSPFVKFHAMQALLLEAVGWVCGVVFGILAAIGILSGLFITLSWLVSVALLVCAIVAMVKAHGYYEFKLPVVGDLALNFSGSR